MERLISLISIKLTFDLKPSFYFSKPFCLDSSTLRGFNKVTVYELMLASVVTSAHPLLLILFSVEISYKLKIIRKFSHFTE